MTESRLEQLLRWSDRKNYPNFEMAIYKCCITFDECKELIEIAPSQNRTFIEDGAKKYFGEAWG